GVRANVGFWVKPWLGLELGGFILEKGEADLGATSNGSIVLARPFINAATRAPDSLLIASPGLASGAIDVHSSSQLYGTELNLLVNAARGCACGVNLLGGFRYVNLEEDLDVTQSTLLLAPGGRSFGGMGLPAGSRLAILDSLDTRNQFYGGQVGLQTGCQMGRFFLGTTAKVAL